jgi:hypothetical protein
MTILPDWTGATVAVIGTGPSLDAGQVRECREAGCKLVAIKRAIELTRDVDWWCWEGGTSNPEYLPHTVSKLHLLPPAMPAPGARMLPDPSNPPLLPYEDGNRAACVRALLRHGLPCPHCGADTRCRWRRIGLAAIEAVMMAGPGRIVLIGLDGGPDAGGFRHFHHEQPLGVADDDDAVLTCYRTVPAEARRLGVEVVNATTGSRIDAFPRVRLENALGGPGHADRGGRAPPCRLCDRGRSRPRNPRRPGAMMPPRGVGSLLGKEPASAPKWPWR